MNRILLLLVLSAGLSVSISWGQVVYNVYATEPSGIVVSPNKSSKPNTATIQSGQTIQLTGYYDQGVAKWYGEGLPATGSPFFSTFITPVNPGPSNLTLLYTVNNNTTNVITVTVLPEQGTAHPTISTATFCTPNPLLTATGCNGLIKWYQRQGNGTTIPYVKALIPGAEGASYQTTANGFYTATCTVDGKESFGSFLTSVYSGGIQPSISILPPVSGNNVCMWSNQTLLASGDGLDAGKITWYEKIGTDAFTAIGSETTKNVQITNLNTQYYAQLAVPGCVVTTSFTETFTVKKPLTLANSGEITFKVHKQPYDGLTGQNILGNANCQLIASFKPNLNWDGIDVTTGKRITAKVSVDNSVKVYNNQPYVQRHYDFEPENPSETQNAWYQIVLYFTQAEFDAFNAASTVKLPLNSTDIENYASNLRIWQAHGTPNSLPAAPGKYTSVAEVCVPCTSVGWDAGLSVWKVTHNSQLGFSGFFLTAQNATPLPVTLFSFKARKQEEAVVVDWQTTEETNSDHFELQRSSDTKRWTAIGVVKAIGESKGLTPYAFTDNAISSLSPSLFPNGIFYRLKMIDRDATIAYSRIVSVSTDRVSEINVFPNPAGREINFTGSIPVKGYKILNSAGQSISEKQIPETVSGKITLPPWPVGIYYLELYEKDGHKHLRKVMIAP